MVKRILRHSQGTVFYRLTYISGGSLHLNAYNGSDWAADLNTRVLSLVMWSFWGTIQSFGNQRSSLQFLGVPQRLNIVHWLIQLQILIGLGYFLKIYMCFCIHLQSFTVTINLRLLSA